MNSHSLKCLALLLALILLAGSFAALSEDIAFDDAEVMEFAEEDVLPQEIFEEPEELEFIEPEGSVGEMTDLELTGDVILPSAVGNAASASDDSLRFQFPINLPDSDALFAAYVDQIFGVKGTPQKNGAAGKRLPGELGDIYDYMAGFIRKVASGKINYTVANIPEEIAGPDIMFDYWDLIYTALEEDLPYELYWVDGHDVMESVYQYPDGWFIYFPVNEAYAKGDSYNTDPKKITAVAKAAKNAKKVVKKNAGLPDHKKLQAYANYICKATSYNYDAHKEGDYNAWQLIWVFDGDPSTKVVCAGYAKAFQYLCELTKFQYDVRCRMVGGAVNGGSHAWNVVTMEDGRNYLMDVTLADVGSKADLSFFLKGYSEAHNGSYTYKIGGVTAKYVYDSYTLKLYAKKELQLSKSAYKSNEKKPTSVSITRGKTAEILIGDRLCLETKVKPTGATAKTQWKSSKPAVASVDSDGVVTGKKIGKARITATTQNGKKATITVSVKKVIQGKEKSLRVKKPEAVYDDRFREIVVSWKDNGADYYELCYAAGNDISEAGAIMPVFRSGEKAYEVYISYEDVGKTFTIWVRGVKNCMRSPYARCSVKTG